MHGAGLMTPCHRVRVSRPRSKINEGSRSFGRMDYYQDLLDLLRRTKSGETRGVETWGAVWSQFGRLDMILPLGFGFGGPPIEQRHHD